MYMADWNKQLDDFLSMTGKEILNHAGEISHHQALEKAHTEYKKYKEKIKDSISQVEKDFIKQLENNSKSLKRGKG